MEENDRAAQRWRRVEGTRSLPGQSSIYMDGIFSIHGTEHERRVPAEVKTGPGDGTATLHFAVPYAMWGMKNPSTLFLKVSESVDIDLTTSGHLTRP